MKTFMSSLKESLADTACSVCKNEEMNLILTTKWLLVFKSPRGVVTKGIKLLFKKVMETCNRVQWSASECCGENSFQTTGVWCGNLTAISSSIIFLLRSNMMLIKTVGESSDGI